MTRISILFGLLSFISSGAPRPDSRPACAPAPAGLSAWFTFDEALFRNAPAERVRQGMVGAALAFDGKSQFVEAPASIAGLDVGEEDFSIEFWLRTRDGTRTRNIVDKRDKAPRGYLIFIQRGHIGVQVAAGANRSDVIAGDVTVADGRWRHIAAVCRRLPPGPPLIYVDGVARAASGRSVPLDDLDNHTPLWLGRHHGNRFVLREDIYFEGAVDELSVYRRALRPDEVRAIHRAGKAGKCRRRN